MNSFFVPQLGSQIYTMAGMATQLNLLADRPGTYPGISAQFSGDGFSDMKFDVQAVQKAEFDSWVTASAQIRRSCALDTAGYAKPDGAEQGGGAGLHLSRCRSRPVRQDIVGMKDAAARRASRTRPTRQRFAAQRDN